MLLSCRDFAINGNLKMNELYMVSCFQATLFHDGYIHDKPEISGSFVPRLVKAWLDCGQLSHCWLPICLQDSLKYWPCPPDSQDPLMNSPSTYRKFNGRALDYLEKLKDEDNRIVHGWVGFAKVSSFEFRCLDPREIEAGHFFFFFLTAVTHQWNTPF